MQGQVAGGIQYAVLSDNDVLGCFFVQRFNGDVALFRLGLTVHGNRTVLGGQHDILLCHQSRIVGCVMSDGDVALSGFNIDAAAKGSYCMEFRGSIIGSLSHGYIAVVGHDINIPANNDISPKLYVAYIIHNHIKISLCQGIIGYFNTAVIGMQCQVAARIQPTVFGNYEVFRRIVVNGVNADIAIPGRRMPVYRDYTVHYIQINVFLSGNCISPIF